MISWCITIVTAILILYLANHGISVDILLFIGFVGSVLATIFDPIWED